MDDDLEKHTGGFFGSRFGKWAHKSRKHEGPKKSDPAGFHPIWENLAGDLAKHFGGKNIDAHRKQFDGNRGDYQPPTASGCKGAPYPLVSTQRPATPPMAAENDNAPRVKKIGHLPDSLVQVP